MIQEGYLTQPAFPEAKAREGFLEKRDKFND